MSKPAAEPRTWSWRGHIAIVVVAALVAGVLTGLLKAKVIDLGGDGMFSHDDLVGDVLLIIWASAGAFALVSSALLAAGLRKGKAVLLPYVLGVAAIPGTWMLLDKWL